MAAEDKEIAVQGLHVGLLVRHALGPVDQRQGPGPVARPTISATGLIVPSTLEIAVKATSFVRSPAARRGRPGRAGRRRSRGCAAARPAALGKLLPGDEIRVMLHLGEQDLVARLDVRVAPAPRHGIDARGGPVGENDCSAGGR